MSAEIQPEQSMAAESVPTANMTPIISHPHKSFRRKYRKIMVRFEEQMRENTNLFKSQQKLQDISLRIAEQTDQLLELLLELNTHIQVPARLRYDLSDVRDVKKDTVHELDSETALELRKFRHQIQKGSRDQTELQDLERRMLGAVDFPVKNTYSDLHKLAREIEVSVETPSVDDIMLGGFLSSKQEEQYLQSLDDMLDRKTTNPRQHVPSSEQRAQDKALERERELQLRNPMSVFNWLRRHRPQVFLQDGDQDKSKAASRISKRTPVSKVKAETELYDEEGFAADATTSKGKRKRDDDGGYRPKGGHTRPGKRRKEESGKRSKRASVEVGTPS